ncbi:MAG: hypothetical protein IID03_00675 [Candidatus Dadabacteria bacterium]|nr:hypothetical protein [Candidatus Dadabacteria bacterium]
MTKYLDDITHVLARHELRYYTYCRWFYESFRKTRGVVLCTSGTALCE